MTTLIMIIMLTNDNDENVLYSAQIGLKMKVHTYLFIEETFGCLFFAILFEIYVRITGTIANCSWERAFPRSVSVSFGYFTCVILLI